MKKNSCKPKFCFTPAKLLPQIHYFFKILPPGIWVKEEEIFTPTHAPKDDCSVGRDALEEAFTAAPAVRKMEIVSVDQTILGLHFKPEAAFILAP